MYNDAKYIIAERFQNMDIVPFVFVPHIQHVDYMKMLGLSKWNIVSAGFVSVGHDGIFEPYGESVSIGAKTRPADKMILNKMFNTQFYIDYTDGLFNYE